MASVMRISPLLPWDRVPEEESRFRRILLVIMLLLFVGSLVITWIKLPAPPRVIKPVVTDRLVKLVVEKKELPPPPPVELPKVEEKPVEEKPAEVAKVEPTPTEVPKPVPADKADGKPAGPSVAKEKARAAIAVFDSLAELRSDAAPAARPGKALSNASTPSLAGPGDAPVTQRSLVADRAKAGSGGIVTARASVDQGGGTGIAGSGTSRVVSGIGGTGGEGSGIGGTPASADPNASRTGKSAGGRRPDENIQQGFDNAKASIFALYNRALRSNPDLKGKVIFRLEIQPNGSVSSAEVVSSELDDPELERKLLAKVRQIDFGAFSVSIWKDTYRMDFFPT